MGQIAERDWKVLRRIRDNALHRLSVRMISGVRKIVSEIDPDSEAHAAFLSICRYVHEQNLELGNYVDIIKRRKWALILPAVLVFGIACAVALVLLAGLRELQARHALIGDVRGQGLMVGVEFVDENGSANPGAAAAVHKTCLQQNLLLLTCGSYGNVIRWIPPLIVSGEQIDEAVAIFTAALKEHFS